MLYFLAGYTPVLEGFKSIYLRGFLAFILAFLIVLVAGKPFIKYLKKKKFGEEIREEGPVSHFSKKGTPTMGGILIIFGTLLTSLLVSDLTNKFIILMIVITLLFSGIGFVDDYKKFTVNKKGLSGKKKLLGQCCIAFGTWYFIKTFGLTGNKVIDLSIVNPMISNSNYYLGSFLMLLFIAIVLMGTSNAVNITDGLDGLAIMPVVIGATILGIITYFTGHTELSKHLNLHYIAGIGELTVFLSALIGSGLGFLWYNFYPAQIFMGDTGSLTLGGILGVVAILLKQELLLPIIGGVFVLEAVSVILQVGSFKLRGKRVFRMAPIHHHFELAGLPETKVTMRFWIVALFLGMIALGIVRMRGIL
ncbi:phospho-N-acetylmuramoyl-pentapeptide-transferase [Cetobacterium sp. 8H]|uniref:phospho-N-acetylmuramoyl-pentapeptide- transferase n=1 Tax=Cetobacterium sp. 8H TaxID=2759681 RepID=UPI00163C9CB8|nr:phospho-N-acetylmuramoyl-pentapeptide-transferase [Cetobacterium sp. 8H]MBC2850772.1 phospho-N-acetylmuramoyl-pentapeptide-transferase [Cetobacterium sp. 8H]